jgi:hypothetical protein
MSYSSGTPNREMAGALGAGAPTSGGSDLLLDRDSREHANNAGSSTTRQRVVANDGTGATD